MFKKRLIEKANIGKTYSTRVNNAIDKDKVNKIKFYIKVFLVVGVISTILILNTIWGGQLDFDKK